VGAVASVNDLVRSFLESRRQVLKGTIKMRSDRQATRQRKRTCLSGERDGGSRNDLQRRRWVFLGSIANPT